jgi:hypothetical protein
MSTKSQKAHDDKILELAHTVAYAFRNLSTTALQNVSHRELMDWEDFQSKEYLDDADVEWPEKRIQILLELLTSCHSKERKNLLRALAYNIDSYASIVAHCPSGMFSKDIDKRVANVLDGVL